MADTYAEVISVVAVGVTVSSLTDGSDKFSPWDEPLANKKKKKKVEMKRKIDTTIFFFFFY